MMHLRIILLLSIGIIGNSAFSQVITVKQDGTGDFTLIQEAVDQSVDGDTILVYPGTYVENVYYNGKNITLGSLTLVTGDLSYVGQTIIDGNQSGPCVTIYNSNTGSKVCGLTLTNGSGRDHGAISGGGIFIKYSLVDLENCNIHNNKVTGKGGGLFCHESYIYLSGVTIKNNYAFKDGGGIQFQGNVMEFDTTNLCNIYLNYAKEGTDISKNTDSSLHVVVDTFTVLHPDAYYMYSSYANFILLDDITWEVNHGKIQTVSEDLYVSPNGDNNNSGLEPASPLHDIWFALLKMAPDSLSPDTIHLAPGTYKMSAGEKYPLSLKKYVSIKGSSRDSCVLDAENQIFHLNGSLYSHSYCLSGFTMQNGLYDSRGTSSVMLNKDTNSLMENILIKGNSSRLNALDILNSNNFTLKDVTIRDNAGGEALRIGHGDFTADTAYIKNCIISGNLPDYSISPEEGGYGGGIAVIGTYDQFDSNNVFMENTLVVENHSRDHPYGGTSANGLALANLSNMYAINCTFGNNTSDNQLGGNIAVNEGSKLWLYNSILYENHPAEIYMYSYLANANLYIYNSLVQGGEEGIRIYTSGNTVYYDPTNIDTDPMWDTAGMYPYSLMAGSPCIDAGTLNLPEGITLPETDLAGNPRVYNGYVDMGAYEYGPWVQAPEIPKIPKTALLSAYPNPFYYETHITYTIPEQGHTLLRVFDMTGKPVATLMDVETYPGSGTITWRGKDDFGNKLPQGTYVVAISLNGKEREAVKVVVGGAG